MDQVFISEDLLAKSIVDAQPESVVWFKPIWQPVGDENEKTLIDFEVCYCNHAAGELLSAPVDQVIGQRLLQSSLIDDHSKQLIFQQCAKVWLEGGKEQLTYYNAGLQKYFNVLRSKVLDGVISVTRDFTAEVLTNNALKEQAELLNSILDASINAVFACKAIRNEEGVIVDLQFLKFNKMFLELTRRTENDLLHQTYLQAFPSAKELFELNCSVIESGLPVRREYYFKGDGLDAWYDISLARLGDDGLVVTFNDITESKHDKLALITAAENLQNAIDSSQTGITVIRPVYEGDEITDFRYRVVNKTFAAFSGKDPAEMVGQLLSDMFPLYKAQGTFERYKRIYTTGDPERFDLHYVKDPHDVWADILAKKVGNEIIVTFHDYTPLKHAQLQLEALVKELKRSNASLEDFAFAASHDLQEPLRKIHFFSDKLKRQYQDAFDDNGLMMFQKMEAATQRMRDLIDDLLLYSQMNSKPKEESRVDLNEVLQVVLSDLERSIQEKNARITSDILPTIEGDQQQIRQIFLNLLSNSLKYTYPDRLTFISIRTRRVKGRDSNFNLPAEQYHTDYHLIEVTDNGIGFDQKEAEKIFHVFQRLHGKTEYSGTGVGLAIVKKAIDNHKGHIAATAEEGKGATFSVLLPALPEPV